MAHSPLKVADHHVSAAESSDGQETLTETRTGVIDDVFRSVSQCDDPEKRDEGKKIVEEIAKLKYEVQHDRQLTYVFDSSTLTITVSNCS